MIFFSLIFSLVTSLSFAQDDSVKKQDYPLDERYKGGEHLIYDCQRKHYACVNQDGYDQCSAARVKSQEQKAAEYACAPLKSFQSKKSCVIKNYEVMEKNAWKRFCFPK